MFTKYYLFIFCLFSQLQGTSRTNGLASRATSFIITNAGRFEGSVNKRADSIASSAQTLASNTARSVTSAARRLGSSALGSGRSLVNSTRELVSSSTVSASNRARQFANSAQGLATSAARSAGAVAGIAVASFESARTAESNRIARLSSSTSLQNQFPSNNTVAINKNNAPRSTSLASKGNLIQPNDVLLKKLDKIIDLLKSMKRETIGV